VKSPDKGKRMTEYGALTFVCVLKVCFL